MSQNLKECKNINYYATGKEPTGELLVNAVYDLYQDKTIVNSKMKLLVQKMNQLYVTYRQSYFCSSVSNNEFSLKYCEKLNDDKIKKHLRQEQMVYCHPLSNYSTKWFSFNIMNNGETSLEDIREYTKKIISALQLYIPAKYIYCYRDGSGGYSVIVHLRDFTYIDKINKFKKHIWVLFKLNIKNVEMKPKTSNYSSKENTLLLPLSKNLSNTNPETNFCCFVNINTLEPFLGQYRYFMNIKALPFDIFYNKSMLATRHYNKKLKKVMKKL